MDNDTTPAPTDRPTTTAAVSGTPCWVSLMTRDLKAAQEFYGGVLGWTFRGTELGEESCIALEDGRPVAGISALAPALHASVSWTPYFAVADADVATARVRERSGTIAVGPLSFEVGRGAIAADRDGAAFGIWQGRLVHEWEAWRSRTPAWIGLRTRDAFEAAIFYGEILEWGRERPGSPEVRYERETVVLRSSGHIVAELSSGALEAAPDPLLRPRWEVHFRVRDVASCTRAVLELGGQVTGERATALGPEATLRDPDGGVFTVNEHAPADR